MQFLCCYDSQVKAWEEKVSAVEEEQIKHRAALESELKNLKASQEELAATFDASLLSLQEVGKQLHCCCCLDYFGL